MIGLIVYIGLGARFKHGKTLLWRSALVNKERGLVMMVQEGGLRRDASPAKQGRGPKVRSAIQKQRSKKFY